MAPLMCFAQDAHCVQDSQLESILFDQCSRFSGFMADMGSDSQDSASSFTSASEYLSVSDITSSLSVHSRSAFKRIKDISTPPLFKSHSESEIGLVC